MLLPPPFFLNSPGNNFFLSKSTKNFRGRHTECRQWKSKFDFNCGGWPLICFLTVLWQRYCLLFVCFFWGGLFCAFLKKETWCDNLIMKWFSTLQRDRKIVLSLNRTFPNGDIQSGGGVIQPRTPSLAVGPGDIREEVIFFFNIEDKLICNFPSSWSSCGVGWGILFCSAWSSDLPQGPARGGTGSSDWGLKLTISAWGR